MAAKAPKEKPILSIDGVPTGEGLIKTGLARRTFDRQGRERIQISKQGQAQIKAALAANAEQNIRNAQEGRPRGINHQPIIER